jgi:hypothetical protein
VADWEGSAVIVSWEGERGPGVARLEGVMAIKSWVGGEETGVQGWTMRQVRERGLEFDLFLPHCRHRAHWEVLVI